MRVQDLLRSPAARFGLAGFLAGMALCWGWNGLRTPRAEAQSGPSSRADATGTIAFTTQTAGPAQLLYLVDTRSQAFAIYRVDPQKGAIKLEAARPYRWDLKLEYNNLPPEVGAVEAMVSTPAAPKR